MKKILLSLSLLLAVPQLRAEPFTYQGKLENAGAPYTGTVTVSLGLFTSATGGVAIRSQSFPGTAVTGGVFSVTATSFQAADFNGAARYLEITVNDGVTSTTLAPRQEVTWAAMAMHAKKAETVTGTVPAAQITGTLPATQIASGSLTNMTFANVFVPPVGIGFTSPFSVGSNTNKVASLNTDLLDGLDSSAFIQASGDTMTGNLGIANTAALSFGNQARQTINLYNADYGIGIQTNTLYQRTASDFSWHRGGSHNDAQNSSGGGTEVMRLTGSDLWLRPGVTTAPRGRVVFGDLFPGGAARVAIGEPAGSSDVDELELTGSKIRISSFGGNIPTITFGATTGQHLVLFENGADTYGIGVQSGTQYFRTGDQFAWYRDGVHSDIANSSGGGTTLMTLSANGTLTARGPDSGFNVINRDNSAQEWAMYSRNSGGVGQLAFWNSTNGADVAAFSPNGDLYLVGEVSTTVMTIRGGADVAEPFEMTNPDEMEPGTVVIIDEENPGHLKESAESYDTRVAGIISGAGGVKPGLRLHQEGVMEGDHHVALSGRVYVKADASSGKIKPGDLLTTSSTPGHAMKVKDHSKAQGAILGKAMSRLDEGTGLVLVLVTLQ